jgi:hypothetical protein
MDNQRSLANAGSSYDTVHMQEVEADAKEITYRFQHHYLVEILKKFPALFCADLY